MLEEIHHRLSTLYDEYTYLRDNLPDYKKVKYDRILCTDREYGYWAGALRDLAQILHEYHGQKSIVLIDEYDHPIDTSFHDGYYQEARNFFASLMGNLLKVSISFHSK